MTNNITATNASTPATKPLQIHAYTGSQLKSALEKHYKALTSQINKIKLHNQKLSNPIQIKNTAINALTFGEYRNLYIQQKSLNNNPIAQEQTRQLIRDIETKYTTPPHTIELSKEIKAHEGMCNIYIQCNNNTLAVLEAKISATLTEKRKIVGRETETFKSLSDKISDLPNDALFQSNFIAKPTQTRAI